MKKRIYYENCETITDPRDDTAVDYTGGTPYADKVTIPANTIEAGDTVIVEHTTQCTAVPNDGNAPTATAKMGIVFDTFVPLGVDGTYTITKTAIYEGWSVVRAQLTVLEVDGTEMIVSWDIGGGATPSTQVRTFRMPVDPTGNIDCAAVVAFTEGTVVHPRAAVRLASVAPLAAYTPSGGAPQVLTADANGALTIDAVLAADGDAVLLKDEAAGDAPYNGTYLVTDKGSAGTPWILTRRAAEDTSAEVVRYLHVAVTAGATLAGNEYLLTTANPIVLDTTDLVWTLYTGTTSVSTLKNLITTVEVWREVSEWDELRADHATAATFGNGVHVATGDMNDIADKVWDEVAATHVAAGSTGAALNTAGAVSAATIADAVWDEALAGHLTNGTAGHTTFHNFALRQNNVRVVETAWTTGNKATAGYILTYANAVDAGNDVAPWALALARWDFVTTNSGERVLTYVSVRS